MTVNCTSLLSRLLILVAAAFATLDDTIIPEGKEYGYDPDATTMPKVEQIQKLSTEDINKMDYKTSLAQFKSRDFRTPEQRPTSKRLIQRMMAIQNAEGTGSGPTEADMIEYNIRTYTEKNDPQFRYCKTMFSDLNPSNENLENIFGVSRSEAARLEEGKQRLSNVCETYENAGTDLEESGSGASNMALEFDRMNCRHIIRVFGLQYHMTDRAYREDNDHICVLMVENIVSAAEEPKCMEWMELVSVELREILFEDKEPGQQFTWPQITLNTHFDVAASSACELMDMDGCENTIQQVKLIQRSSETEQGNSDYIERVCTTSGLSLLQYPGTVPVSERTRRNQIHKIYHQIAAKQAEKQGVEFKPSTKRTSIPALYQGLKRAEEKERARQNEEDEESAARRLLGSSGDNHRRRYTWATIDRGVHPYNPAGSINDAIGGSGTQYRLCRGAQNVQMCGEGAHTIGLTASVNGGGVMLGGEAGIAFGWTENFNFGLGGFKMGLYQDYAVVCAGSNMDEDFGASVAFVAGYMQDFQSVNGWSRTHEVSGSYWFIEVGAGIVECCAEGWSGCQPCGGFSSVGVTLPGPPGVDISSANCFTELGAISDPTRDLPRRRRWEIRRRQILENHGGDGPRRRVNNCQGDCDNDAECHGSLKCFQRDGYAKVPGCYDARGGSYGPGTNDYDYCARGLDSSPGVHGLRRRQQMTQCRGDCDSDVDCANGLVCFQRDMYDPVPGCAGTGNQDWDYCTNQHEPCELGARCPTCFIAQPAMTCDSCFPADATVTTPGGEQLMQDLRVGDKVLTTSSDGTLIFEDVYFFGHANAETVAKYVELGLEGALKLLEISPKHFVPLCPVTGQPCEYSEHVYKYAQETVPGDHLWVAGANSTVELARVKEVGHTLSKGVFNPYTLGGSVVVNNVLASAHSNWVLDGLVPASATGYLPYVYQALFAPGRVLYNMLGASAATVLDMNSPQQQEFGHGLQFLVAALVLPFTILALSTKRFS